MTEPRIRKVKVLVGKVKVEAEKLGLNPNDLVIIKNGSLVEKIEGDPVSFLIKRLQGEKMRRNFKGTIQKQAIRLLQNRAGGRYRMFEAGMLYQCLRLLGMPEYTKREQVDALEKITCHYFHENEAKLKLEELLGARATILKEYH